MKAHTFFADYLVCAYAAREYATAMGRPVALRKVSEYGRRGFTFNLKSNDGADYLAETIMPGEPQAERGES